MKTKLRLRDFHNSHRSSPKLPPQDRVFPFPYARKSFHSLNLRSNDELRFSSTSRQIETPELLNNSSNNGTEDSSSSAFSLSRNNSGTLDSGFADLESNTGLRNGSNLTTDSESSSGGILDKVTSVPIYVYIALLALALLVIIGLVLFFVRRFIRKRQMRNTLLENFEKSGKGKKKTVGEVHYVVHYNYIEKELKIEIVQIKDITILRKRKKEVDMKEFAVYVKVSLIPGSKRTFETEVVSQTLNPKFDQSFKFKCSIESLTESKVLFRLIQHHKFLRDMPIGDGVVELFDEDFRLGPGSVPMTSYNPALDDPLGEVCVTLRYNPLNCRLSITIIECKQLKPTDFRGKADPYVKIIVTVKDKLVFKDKTEIQKGTSNPYYNEAFTVHIAPNQLPLVDLLIMVKDYDMLGTNDEIGSVRMGMEPDSETAEKQWDQMIENLKRPQTAWHHLMPSQR